MGSGAAVQMVSKEKKDWVRIGQILFRWYESTKLPTEISNRYASNHQFLVPKYKSDKILPQSVSHSIFCHVSVGRWCETSGYASGSPERSERCARIAGDVVAKAVELLNLNLRGALPEAASKVTLSPYTAGCRTCHYKGKNYEQGQFERGFLECESCHKDMRPHISGTKLQTAFGTPIDTWAKFLTGAAVGGIGVHLITKLARGEHEES